MSDTELTKFVENANAFMKWLWSVLNPNKVTTRVQPGGKTSYTVESHYQYIQKYQAMEKSVRSTGADSNIFNYLLVMLLCTFSTPNMGYDTQCYDNIWADLSLNGGDLDKDNLLAWVDLFTWKGWVELGIFMIVNNGVLFLLEALIIVGYLGINYATTSLPFCVAADDLEIFGEPCTNFSTLTKTW